MDICQSSGRLHYYVILSSVKSRKPGIKLSKRIFPLPSMKPRIRRTTTEMKCQHKQFVFSKRVLRNTTSLLTHGPSNQQHLNGQNHKSSHNHVDSIWDKCQKLGNLKQAATHLSIEPKFLHNVDELEKTSSLFKHVVPDNVNFLTQNNYRSFTNSQHSSVLKKYLST